MKKILWSTMVVLEIATAIILILLYLNVRAVQMKVVLG